MSNGAPFPYEPPPRDRGHTTGGTPRATDDGRSGTVRRRSRARTLLPLSVAAWAVLEIWLLTLVAGAAGGLTVLLLLVAGLLLGTFLVRRAGRRAWQQLSATLNPAAVSQPSEHSAGSRRTGNTLTMLGGLLLIVPGLVSDAAGLLCLFPPTAALLRRAAERKLASAGLGTAGPGDAMRRTRSAAEQFRGRRPAGNEGRVVRDEDDPGPR